MDGDGLRDLIGEDVGRALLRLAQRGRKRVHLVLCRDRKSAGYRRCRVIGARTDGADVRLIGCGFPEPRDR